MSIVSSFDSVPADPPWRALEDVVCVDIGPVSRLPKTDSSVCGPRGNISVNKESQIESETTRLLGQALSSPSHRIKLCANDQTSMRMDF